MLLQRTNRLHQGPFKILADAHDLSCGLHLGSQCTLCRNKFVKGKPWQLDNTVIQRRFKTGVGLARNGIFDLIQRIAKGNFSRHFCDGISRCLAGKRGRTADPGIDFDHTVFKTGRMQCELYITPSCNFQLTDNIQRRAAQHLIFFISQRLRGCYDDTVSRMYTHRVDIFHITYGNAVTGTVPHDLILDLFPARDTALHEYLSHSGKPQTIGQYLFQLDLIVGDTAAASSQCIGRTKHHRITDLAYKGNTILDVFHYFGSRTGFPDLLHRIFEFLSVLCLPDSSSRRPK